MLHFRIVIIEDSALVRERLMIMLAGIEGLSVISALDFSVDAVCSISLMHPDAVVLSIRDGDPKALDLIHEIKQERPDTFLIALSDSSCRECRDRYLAAGVELFLDKADECDQIGPELVRASRGAFRKGVPTPVE